MVEEDLMRTIFFAIFMIGGILTLIVGYNKSGKREGFYPVVLMMYAGLAMILTSDNMFAFFFGWEIMTAGSYFLIIRGKRSKPHAYSYMLFSVVATKDGGVMLAGTRAEVGAPNYYRDGYIIKLDSTGCFVGLSENSNIQIKDVLVYPNPGKEKLVIRTALKNCVIHLFDMKGLEVLNKPLTRHITEINTQLLTSGTYVYVVQQNKRIIDKGKWIKQ